MPSCQECKKKLNKSERTFVRRHKPYCQRCYRKALGRKCGGCGRPIFGDKLSAMEKDWHPEHFKCSVCKKVIQDDTFAIFEDQQICNECKESKNPPNNAIVKRCKVCSQTLLSIKYYVKNSEYFCEPCYQQFSAPKCHTCKEAILAKWICANERTWHSEHFVCHKCADNLIGRPFSFKHGELMCVPCFKKFVLYKSKESRPTVDRDDLDK